MPLLVPVLPLVVVVCLFQKPISWVWVLGKSPNYSATAVRHGAFSGIDSYLAHDVGIVLSP
jgi:hypothetical protein